MIYVIGEEDRLTPVKIGWTAASDASDRLGSLQTGHPHQLSVLALLPGTRAGEVALHLRFSDYRLKGEWFAREGRLFTWLYGVVGTPPPQEQLAASVEKVSPSTRSRPNLRHKQADENSILVRVEEAARRLGLSRTTLFKLIGDGVIPSVKLGGRRLISPAAIERFAMELQS